MKINFLLKMIEILRSILKIQSKIEKKETENGKKISEFLKRNIGNSFTQDVDFDGDIDKDDEMVNCAAVVNKISEIVLGEKLAISKLGNINVSVLLEDIKIQQWRFFEVSVKNIKEGDIIISIEKNRHTGYYYGNNLIASNNSFTGKLDTHYTLERWKNRFGKILIFRIK